MDFDLEIRLPGDPAYTVLLSRLLTEASEHGEVPEEEVQRLRPPLETLIRSLLEGLAREPAPRGLTVRLDIDEVHVGVDLEVEPTAAPGGGGSLLEIGGQAALDGLRTAFDEVAPGAGGGLRLRLVRHIPC